MTVFVSYFYKMIIKFYSLLISIITGQDISELTMEFQIADTMIPSVQ